MTTWLTDKDGNRCSVEYFGTAEKARAALDSLKDCQNCTNCSGCSDCSDLKNVKVETPDALADMKRMAERSTP